MAKFDIIVGSVLGARNMLPIVPVETLAESMIHSADIHLNRNFSRD